MNGFKIKGLFILKFSSISYNFTKQKVRILENCFNFELSSNKAPSSSTIIITEM